MECKRCGKLTSDLENGFCGECRGKNRSDLNTIRDYLTAHRNANAMDISRETGIPLRVINMLIREETLIIKSSGE